jgi:hypothetical protein
MGKEEGALLEPMRTARVYAGVDVSKDRLDVCVRRSEPERHGGGGGDAFVVSPTTPPGSTPWSLASSRSTPSW